MSRIVEEANGALPLTPHHRDVSLDGRVYGPIISIFDDSDFEANPAKHPAEERDIVVWVFERPTFSL
jgi:hypothetical protein